MAQSAASIFTVVMQTTISFAQRLEQAIAAWSPTQEESVRQSLGDEMITGGRKALLARALGMTSPGQLSDILSGRTPGHRYREPLATLLQVSLGWLEGDDTQAPDWALTPLEAWERFRDRLAKAWQKRCGVSPVGDAEESGRIRLGSAAEEERLARLLDVPLGHVDIGYLARLQYAEASDGALLKLHEKLGFSPPSHPDILAQGRVMARIVEARVEQALRSAQRRYARFVLPPRLFKLARLGLVGLRAQRQHQGKGQQAVDDCLEILWRQQLLAQGHDRPLLSPIAAREIGRPSWTPLTRIRARYLQDENIELPYASTGG